MPGVKSCLEKCLGVNFGPHSFKSGIPRILVPGCVLMFLAVFFIVLGILLCGLHAAYVVSKVSDTYLDYFLIAGIIALVIGFILAIVGSVWCCHVKRNLSDEMDYYRDTKLSRSASLRSSGGVGGLAMNPPADWRYRSQSSRHSESTEQPDSFRRHSSRGSRHRSDMNYPDQGPGYGRGAYPHPSYAGGHYPDSQQASHPSRRDSEGSEASYDPVTDSYVPKVTQNPAGAPNQDRDMATRISDKINSGAKDLQEFVKRNREFSKSGSSPRRNKTPYSERIPGAQDGRHDGIDPVSGQFDLSQTYKQPDAQYYADNPHHDPQYDGGYANIPDTEHAHLTREQRAKSASQPPDPRQSQSKRGFSESAAPLSVHNPPLNTSTDSRDEKLTPVFKDGKWYYYYKGKPVSEYTGMNPEKVPKDGPSYKYINGKPVLVNSTAI